MLDAIVTYFIAFLFSVFKTGFVAVASLLLFVLAEVSSVVLGVFGVAPPLQDFIEDHGRNMLILASYVEGYFVPVPLFVAAMSFSFFSYLACKCTRLLLWAYHQLWGSD